MDVTPREVPPTAPNASRRRLPVIVALLVVLAMAGFLVVRALGNSTMFFYNADEAVAQRDSLGAKRFRLQGTVVDGSVARTADGVSFRVTYGGVIVPVNHVGDPPEMFQPNIPVVLEGHWDTASPDGAFASDRILVKHTNDYDEKNPDRLKEANGEGTTAPPPVTP